ncbi:MAG TPA: tripartite tricarboxylate transporter substrate binding protein [Roseomonas sp.]
MSDPHGPRLAPRPGRRSVLTAALLLPALGVHAAEWPDRPLRMIIPFAAGSTPDVTGRAVAEHYRTALGQPCVVENRTGANGTIGYAAVAQAIDGHTIGICTNGMATATALYPRLPFDPPRDLRFISLLTRAAQLLVVRDGVPARSLAEFIAYAREKPGEVTYGSVGVGSASHLAMEELAERHGLQMVHVPYAGLPPAKLDLLGGRIDAMFGSAPAVLQEVKEGRLQALAVAAGRRDPALPNVPTLAEAGPPNAESYAWNALFAPRALPEVHAMRLAAEAQAALALPRTRGALEAAGFEVVGSSPEACEATIREETERWGGIVRRRGISLNG